MNRNNTHGTPVPVPRRDRKPSPTAGSLPPHAAGRNPVRLVTQRTGKGVIGRGVRWAERSISNHPGSAAAFAIASAPRKTRLPHPRPGMADAFAHGNNIDEVIQIRDHTPATTPEDYWAHQDDLFSVYAITDAGGAVSQRYLYGDYGTRITTDAAGTVGFEPALEVDHGFTGRLHDEISGLIEYRHRWMRPGMGRFVQRDPLWYVDGMNLMSFADVRPFSVVDPYGLCICNPSTWPAINACMDNIEDRARHSTYYMNTQCEQEALIAGKGCCAVNYNGCTWPVPPGGWPTSPRFYSFCADSMDEVYAKCLARQQVPDTTPDLRPTELSDPFRRLALRYCGETVGDPREACLNVCDCVYPKSKRSPKNRLGRKACYQCCFAGSLSCLRSHLPPVPLRP